MTAIEWVADQYQVSIDQRSGITKDTNRPDSPGSTVRLLGQVITANLETGKAVSAAKLAKGVPCKPRQWLCSP